MSAAKMTDHEILTDHDEQGKLILTIDALAYRINQGGIADAQIRHQTHSLHVTIKRPAYGGIELLNVAAGIALPYESDFSKMRLNKRLRDIVHDMEQIYQEGMKPTGSAA